jgi:hypothetical protein
MKMQHMTELYQQTLDDNLPIMASIGMISCAATQVQKGVETLANYNHVMMQSYMGAVGNIQDLSHKHPTFDLIDQSNRDFRALLQADSATALHYHESVQDSKLS